MNHAVYYIIVFKSSEWTNELYRIAGWRLQKGMCIFINISWFVQDASSIFEHLNILPSTTCSSAYFTFHALQFKQKVLVPMKFTLLYNEWEAFFYIFPGKGTSCIYFFELIFYIDVIRCDSIACQLPMGRGPLSLHLSNNEEDIFVFLKFPSLLLTHKSENTFTEKPQWKYFFFS